jgi:hypothetical protein
MENPKKGDLKVWWIPQVPMKAFEYKVNSVQEAFVLLDALALYDLFQLENKIKPDFCNAGGLLVYDEDNSFEIEDDEENTGWSEWYSEMGESIDFYLHKDNGLELLNEDLKLSKNEN